MNSDSKELIALEHRAAHGEVEAEFELGQILYFGRYVFQVHVPQNKRRGYELINRAARKKYEPALKLLAEIKPRVKSENRATVARNLSELVSSLFGLGIIGAILLGVIGLTLFGLHFLFS